jgi:hypothetical protein
MSAKSKNIVYWITTGLVVFFLGGGGLSQIARYWNHPHEMIPVLLYPGYFFVILGIWKVLGSIAIVAPRYPLLKEWAYAGIFFDLTGAAASCIAVGVVGAYAFHVLAPLIIAGLTVASWALRPPSRILSAAA